MISKKYATQLQPVKELEWWPDFIKDIKSETPKLPAYHPYGDTEDKEWIYSSGLKEGYKLALQHFGVNYE